MQNKSVNFIRRVTAYILDIIILAIILNLMFSWAPASNQQKELLQNQNDLYENVLKGEANYESFFKKNAEIVYKINYNNAWKEIVNVLLVIAYFTLIPFYWEGKTLGKKILGIKIIKEDGQLTINDLIFRNMIINGLALSIISLLLLFTLEGLNYFMVLSAVSTIQLLIVFISIILIIVRKDKKGIHDLIIKTKVVEEN